VGDVLLLVLVKLGQFSVAGLGQLYIAGNNHAQSKMNVHAKEDKLDET